MTFRTVGPDGLVSRRSADASTFYAFDPSGSTCAVFNASGSVLGDEAFEGGGRHDGTYSAHPADFSGQWGGYEDSESGFVLMGHRYYDTYTGRFLTRDPIGYNGGFNLYSYTANNYVNRRDQSGFDAGWARLPGEGPWGSGPPG